MSIHGAGRGYSDAAVNFQNVSEFWDLMFVRFLIAQPLFVNLPYMCTLHVFIRPPDKSVYLKIIFSYFSTKTYGVGTRKNPLNSFEYPKHMLKLIGKEINTILDAQTILIRTYDSLSNVT